VGNTGRKNKMFTEEHKNKIRQGNINYWKDKIRIPWNKNKKCPEISLRMIGNKNGSGNKGRIIIEETKEKIRKKLIGRKNPEHSKRMKGRPAWNKDKKRDWETGGEFKSEEIIGENNINWKGDFVGYSAIHSWVKRKKGKPKLCEHCGVTNLKNSQYHWANVDHKYRRNINDYIRLCVPCHIKYDKENNLINKYN